MIASDADLTRAYEGDKPEYLKVYDDATGRPIGPGSHVIGHPTIGIGCALDTAGITEAEKEMLFANRMTRAREAATALIGPGAFSVMNAARRWVFIDMAYELGRDGLADFAPTIALAKAGRWAEVAQHLLSAKAANQAPHRWAANAEIMRLGRIPN
jgi:lysozyme